MTRREVINLYPEPQRSLIIGDTHDYTLDQESPIYNSLETAWQARYLAENCFTPYWKEVTRLAKSGDFTTPVYPCKHEGCGEVAVDQEYCEHHIEESQMEEHYNNEAEITSAEKPFEFVELPDSVIQELNAADYSQMHKKCAISVCYNNAIEGTELCEAHKNWKRIETQQTPREVTPREITPFMYFAAHTPQYPHFRPIETESDYWDWVSYYATKMVQICNGKYDLEFLSDTSANPPTMEERIQYTAFSTKRNANGLEPVTFEDWRKSSANS